jgi:hypothetical protein
VIRYLTIIILVLWIHFSIHSQELGYDSGWSITTGVVYSNLRSTSHTENKDIESALIQEMRNSGPRSGWQLSIGHYIRNSRRWGILAETSVLHSRRSGDLEESFSNEQLIYTRSGIMSFNNLYLQILVAPRIQFGMFNRYYLSLGPYMDVNVMNFSLSKGEQVDYAEAQAINGRIEYVQLEEPKIFDYKDQPRMRQTDFGGVVMLGTMLALPGNDFLTVELRYSRGVFRMSNIPGVRQNRFSIHIGYTMVYNAYESVRKYLPYSTL